MLFCVINIHLYLSIYFSQHFILKWYFSKIKMEELYSEQHHSDFLINIFLYLLYHLSIHLFIQPSIHLIFLIYFNLSTYSPFLSLSISSCISGVIFFLPAEILLVFLLMLEYWWLILSSSVSLKMSLFHISFSWLFLLDLWNFNLAVIFFQPLNMNSTVFWHPLFLLRSELLVLLLLLWN